MKRARVGVPEFRFIKLGKGNHWAQECIEGHKPCIRIGYQAAGHKDCLAGNWQAIKEKFLNEIEVTEAIASLYANQLKQFYTSGKESIWITFYKRKLYWCRASSRVKELKDNSRVREAIGGWSCTDANGNQLLEDNLSGALTKVQGFRSTICKVGAADYLRRKLNAETQPDVEFAVAALRDLYIAVVPLIKRLQWKDFELLADMLFVQAGWQRIGVLGKTTKTIDLAIIAPVTGKTAFVQVKSQAGLPEFQKCKADFLDMSQYDEMYFLVHTPTNALAQQPNEDGIFIITSGRLAELVVSSGLTNWLIRKVS